MVVQTTGVTTFWRCIRNNYESRKKALKIVATIAGVSNEEFQSFDVEAEKLVNSRPFTPPSSDVNDEPLLILNSFLHGRIGG